MADQESRTIKDRCDWMLNLRQIQAQMGPCKVDLFASHLTKQLPWFYSWRPDPEAEGVDAFNHDWSQTRGFANPPWYLIPRCLAQLKRQKARIVLITPLWNTQPWYPILLELLAQMATPADRSCEMPNSTGVCNESKDTRPNCMTHLRESFASRGLSSEAAGILLSSWRPKTKSNYNSLFVRWPCN